MILIGGHRGLGVTDNAFAAEWRDVKNIVPENTIEALAQAFADGADFVEFDVVPAKDGLVVTHSARLADHVFPAPAATHTTLLTVAEIAQLTTGHRGAAQDRIATLDQLLEALAPIVLARPQRFINLEMKEVQSSGLTWSLDDAMRYARGCYDSVVRHGLLERTLFSSFNSANLQCLLHVADSAAPQPQIAQLFDVPDGDGKPIYGDPGLARYMAFTSENVIWALENMPLAGLNPPNAAFAPDAGGQAAMKAAQDWCTRHGKPMPGLYVWAWKENPIADSLPIWQAAVEAIEPAPRRALITDYPRDLRAALKL